MISFGHTLKLQFLSMTFTFITWFNMLEQIVNGRQMLLWELFAEALVRFVERELVDADHAFCANKSQPEY